MQVNNLCEHVCWDDCEVGDDVVCGCCGPHNYRGELSLVFKRSEINGKDHHKANQNPES